MRLVEPRSRVGVAFDIYMSMDICLDIMRTTVRLDPALMARAKEEAARRGETLTSLMERGLRLVLARPAQRQRKARIRIPVSTARGGTRPGVNLDSSAALLDLLDEGDDSSRR